MAKNGRQMMIRGVGCLLMVCLVAPGVVQAEWEQYTVNDGLLHNWVYSLLGDSDGSLWIGTEGVGMNQYVDGQILTWNAHADWEAWAVNGICKARDGTLWCSAHTGCGFLQDGLWCGGFWLYWEFEWGEKHAWSTGIRCASDGRLWASFYDGIMWYDPLTRHGEKVWTTPRYNGIDFNHVPHWLFVASDGHLWFVSNGSTIEMDQSGSVLRTFPDRAGNFAEAPDGTLWMGRVGVLREGTGTSRVQRLEGDEFVDVGPPPGSFPSIPYGPIYIGDNGWLVAAGVPTGLFFFDGADWTFEDGPFPGAAVNDFCFDNDGNVWVATGGELYSEELLGLWVLRDYFQNPPLPMFMGIETDASRYAAGETMRVRLDLVAEGEARRVDFYLALEMPSGELLFYPTFGAEMTPFLSGIEIPADTHLESYELFRLTLPDLPAGTYRWYAACTHAGTTDLASNIASCSWQFTK